MRLLLPPALLILFLLAAALCAGCTSAGFGPAEPPRQTTGAATPAPVAPNPGSSPLHPPVTAIAAATPAPVPEYETELAAVRSDSPIFSEAYRIFRNMKSTEYVHTTYVDEEKGIYRFDCLGFVDYVLQHGTPAAFRSAGRGYERPEMVVYADYFAKQGSIPNAEGWTRVAKFAELKPGDICLWQKKTSDSVGHMWIIAGNPAVNPYRKDEVLVRILDSDGVHGGSDSRADKTYKYGLGTGILGMMTDADGNPAGLYWEGGNLSSPALPDPTIVCGRYTTP